MSDQLTYPAVPSVAIQAAPATRRWLLVARWALVLGLLVLAAWIGLAPMTAVPDALPASAPEAVFSAGRAMAHLETIAAEPRPIGSPRSAEVRAYLVEQLRVMGYEPEVQSASVVRSGGSEAHLIPVHNVLARLEGTGDGPALLLSGHYDSVATSPAASDCGQCTAVILEAARALKAGPPLASDVIILFTDGEEVGVAGAEAFVEQHPWAADVGLSIVTEGYGTRGASMLYVAGQGDGAVQAQALAAMDEATRYPAAYSFIHNLMWTLAGNTGSDLDAFLRLAPGLGFLYMSVESTPAYHTAADSVANLDPRSVQHQGEVVVGLVRSFGGQALGDFASEPDQVIFPLFAGFVDSYPGSVALPLAAVAGLLLVVLLVAGARRGDWRPGGIMAGIGLWLLAFFAAVVAVTLAWWLARALTPALRASFVGGWYGGRWYLPAVLALAAGVVLMVYAVARRRAAPADLYAGALVWWALLSLLTAVALPGWSYLFVWPLLVAILFRGLVWFFRALPGGLGYAFLTGYPAAVAVWLAAAVVAMLWIYSGRMEAIMGVPAAFLPLLIAVWIIALTVPALEPLAARGWAWVAAASAGLALVLFVAAAFLVQPSAAQPSTNSITYRADADSGEAAWIALNDSRAGRGTRGQIDDWTGQFFPDGEAAAEVIDFDPWLTGQMDAAFPALSTPALVVERPQSSLTLQGLSGRFRSLLLEQAEGSELTQVRFSAESPITSASVDGEAAVLEPGASEWLLTIYGALEEPVALEVSTESAGPLTAVVVDAFLGLPTDAGIDIRPRPAHLMPAPLPDVADRTIIEHTVTLE
jgi:hypothetical protein